MSRPPVSDAAALSLRTRARACETETRQEAWHARDRRAWCVAGAYVARRIRVSAQAREVDAAVPPCVSVGVSMGDSVSRRACGPPHAPW